MLQMVGDDGALRAGVGGSLSMPADVGGLGEAHGGSSADTGCSFQHNVRRQSVCFRPWWSLVGQWSEYWSPANLQAGYKAIA